MEKPNIFQEKVLLIPGDASEIGLGISEEDRKLLINKTNILFHVAASVRFDDTLKVAARLNLRGTREVVELAKEMTCLEALVHVSTSYANTNRKCIDEVIYPAFADWRETLEVCENIDEHTLNVLTPKYLGELPNTYVFTKQLAEHVLSEQKGNLPIVIMRPSIVISSVSEPLVGWAENFNGPVGMLVASGKGILRTLYTDPDILSDYIPVDIAIKTFIAAAWARGIKKLEPTDDVTVYNCSSSHIKTMTIGEIVDYGRKEIVPKYPIEGMLWHVGGSLTKSKLVYNLKVLFLHLLPAILVDLVLRITGNKPINLKELDLRACFIEALGNHTFQRMPNLQKLYLGENNIHYIEYSTFNNLKTLKYLDLSRNHAYDEEGHTRDMVFETRFAFENITLEFLDLSFSNFGRRNIAVLRSLQHSLTALSVCYAGLDRVRDPFNFTSLKYLDISGNNELLSSTHILHESNKTLKVLYADDISLKNINCFENFSKLEILKLSNNEITSLSPRVASSLTNLQVLDLNINRMTSWFTETFSRMKNLKLLYLKRNNINVISEEMYSDLKNLRYIGLSENYLVCNCHARDMYEVGLKSEFIRKDEYIIPLNSTVKGMEGAIYNRGFYDFNNIISRRNNITKFCATRNDCEPDFTLEVQGKYFFLDYTKNNNQYQCLQVTEGRSIDVFRLASCSQIKRDIRLPNEYKYKRNRFLLLIIPGILLPVLFFVYTFRKNLKYFVITMRNSAMISLINKNEVTDDVTIFNYDVFVSYCNDDRAWVLDQLLPHVERDCNISVCLHERDFQVGLSILENIVSCMDRSRSIMLVISKKFLLSQWCQFEMHLAQHRLLETRREDLIIILLEDIPKRLRPNTLHYLMLTKTYIVWPKEDSEQNLFWRRMKKSLVIHKLKQPENVSLA